MKRYCVVAILMLSLVAYAQAPQGAPQIDPKNPVVSVVKGMFEGRARAILSSADLMPAEKWNYKPTDAQQTFGEVMSHIATSNGSLCARIGDGTAPEVVTSSKGGDGKEKITAALKASFDFCRDALSKADDSKLADQVPWRNNTKIVRARPIVELPVDLYDHYAAIAGYLRLNNILPPTAQPRPQ